MCSPATAGCRVVRLEAEKVTTRNAFGKCVSERASKAQQERSESRRSAFAMCEKPGPGKDNRQLGRAYGECVSTAARAKNREADRRQRERSTNPARACRAEQKSDADAFKAYGTNESKSNAFGKCVSSKADDQGSSEESQQQ